MDVTRGLLAHLDVGGSKTEPSLLLRGHSTGARVSSNSRPARSPGAARAAPGGAGGQP